MGDGVFKKEQRDGIRSGRVRSHEINPERDPLGPMDICFHQKMMTSYPLVILMLQFCYGKWPIQS